MVASGHTPSGKAWDAGGIADRAPRKRLLDSFVKLRPAGAAGSLCPWRWPGRRFGPRPRAIPRRAQPGRNP